MSFGALHLRPLNLLNIHSAPFVVEFVFIHDAFGGIKGETLRENISVYKKITFDELLCTARD